ncbi:MFS transporter [Streptomyces sp. NPDC101150]|uniref:MFS transporter n=1 Tax=Streptomyces sp. NPDC101150 TaxID=3366114 RepID=UPI0038065B1C
MTVNPSRATVAKSLDDAKLSVFHLKAAVTAGAGFFTDSYDLNVIGTVTLLITPQFHLDSGQVAMLTSSTLLAVAVGAMAFGRLGDLLGRRRVYGLEAILMIIGALVSALAPNFAVLVIGRLILGIGIGGDYPASGVIMTEYANTRNRGKLVGFTFIFYVFGQVSAYLVSLLVLAVGVPDDIAWRVILGVGVIPSLLVLHQRRHMPESPRWTAHSGDPAQAVKDFESFAQRPITAVASREPVKRTGRATGGTLSKRRVLIALAGTAGSWFFYNVAVYGINVSQPLLIKNIVPNATTVSNIALNAVLVVCFSLVGGIFGVVALDRMRRRTQQAVGFGLCALTMLLITAVPGLSATVVPFTLTFGMSLFGSMFGPSYTTMLLAAESYPTSIRSTFHGLSSGIAKVGAFAGALIVPLLLADGGLRIVTLVASCCFLAGIATTFLVREPNGLALDDISHDLAVKPVAKDAAAVSSGAEVQA